MNTHYVSSYQKISSFIIQGNQKKGGDVASYFCTPDGVVLHAIAGKVKAAEFLREAHWAVESWKLAQLIAPDQVRGKALFRKLHMERLWQDYYVDLSKVSLPPSASLRTLANQLQTQLLKGGINPINSRIISDHRYKVHLLLAVNPLPRLEQIYATVFEEILNQKVSTVPVIVQSW